MLKLNLKINGRSVSSASEIERELKKAAMGSIQENLSKRVRSLGVRARLKESGGKYSVELNGSSEGVEKAKALLAKK